MKSTNKVNRFDYLGYESGGSLDFSHAGEYEFWGFHKKNGRLHIDTKRYKKVCEEIGITDFLPEGLFLQRNTPYYEPSKVERSDYKVNLFRDFLGELGEDWANEYKPLLSKLLTPEEVEEAYRLDSLATTSCTDDYDEICSEAVFAAMRRRPKYIKAMKALYCQFIQKIATEVDRCILRVMVACGFDEKDLTFDKFLRFSNGLVQTKQKPNLESLEEYDSFNLLRKINNFLKHNTLASYEDLKKRYPNNVASLENKTASIKYENGMFGGDWIIVKEGYIDNLLPSLTKFFEDYCRVYLGEDIERSTWDYDGYFYDAMRQMEDPLDYFGI